MHTLEGNNMQKVNLKIIKHNQIQKAQSGMHSTPGPSLDPFNPEFLEALFWEEFILQY